MPTVYVWGLGRRPLWMVLSATVIAATTAAVGVLTFKFALLPPHPVGGDFRVLYSAGWMVRHGRDPYNTQALMDVMSHITDSGPLKVPLPFVYVPWLGAIMVPFSLLPFWAAYGLWVAFTFVVISAGTYLWARALGWRFSRTAALVASFSTVAFINYDLGQVAALAAGLLVAVLLTVLAGRLWWAGALAMTGAMLLPQDLFPLVAVLWVAAKTMYPARWRQVLFGQATAFVALVGASLLIHFSLLAAWIQSLFHFGTTPPFQSELAGISGLVTFAPSSWHLSQGLSDPFISLVAVAGVLVVTALLRWLVLSPAIADFNPARRAGWLILLPLGVWLVATPYAHIQDVAAAFPLTMLTLGDRGIALRVVRGWVALISVLVIPVLLTFFSPYLFPQRTLAPLGLVSLVGLGWMAVLRESRAALTVKAQEAGHDQLPALATESGM